MECECGQKSKYKCPSCKTPYCSVNCCKIHKISCQSFVSEGKNDKKVVKQLPRNFLLEDEDDIEISRETFNKMSEF
jgi:hypothetical protein